MAPPEAKLLEVDRSEHLALLNEVYEKRREEVEGLKFELDNLRAKMTSERAQWSQQRANEDLEQRKRAQELDAAYTRRMSEAEQYVRAAEQSLEQQRRLEAQAEERAVEAQRRLDVLADLNKERMEIELLRHQLEETQRGFSEREAAALQKLNSGAEALSRAEAAMKQVEAQRLALNDLEAVLNTRQEALVLRQKQVEHVEAELDAKLAQYLRVEAIAKALEAAVVPQPEETVHAESVG